MIIVLFCRVIWCYWQVLTLLVHDMVDDQLTKLVCTACDLAMRVYTCNLPECFTEQDLEDIDKLIVNLRNTLQRLYGGLRVSTSTRPHSTSCRTSQLTSAGWGTPSTTTATDMRLHTVC
jgi:hypothetical protein